jgi:hypothetical protein
MENETPKHASELTEKEWRELTEKARLGWDITPTRAKPGSQKTAREFSDAEWRRELDRMHVKGRNR